MQALIKLFSIALFGLFGLANITAQANKSTFAGRVADENQLPIPGATVMVLEKADSTLVQFASSNAEGVFEMKNVNAGDYLLQITFLGMAPHFQGITSGTENRIDLGTIVLKESSTVLSEIQVTADHVPVGIDKDTIIYNADAFQVQPNAAVEELLKKLPGIEVEPDGTIKAQGEQVKKVLVDGKEFFGDDPKIATKNLPARALKNVKVYDKKSDVADFTGVDDGEREKTIDLQLREDFREGLFGTAQAGYGTDTRYNARASINRFSKSSQLSFLGQLNNVNDQGFSFTDRMNFSGGMRGGRGGTFIMGSDVSGMGGNSGGLTQTGAGGINFNWIKNPKFKIRSSYFYNGVSNMLDQYAFRQNQSANPFDTEQTTDRETRNQSHNLSLNSEIELDSFNMLRVSARAGLSHGTANSNSELQNIVSSIVENQSVSQTRDESDQFSLNSSLTYLRKLNSRGRNFSLTGTYAKGDQDTESYLDALNEYFMTGDVEVLDQEQYLQSNDRRVEGQFTFVEPLRKRRFLELSYSYNRQEADYNKAIYDLDSGMPILNPQLSTDYTSAFTYHRPGAFFRYSGESLNIQAGAQYQISDLAGIISQSEDEIERDYKHLLPRFSLRWTIGNGKNLNFQYNTRVSQPSINQLSPVIDNSDPLRIYMGNPDLDAEYSHSANIFFHSFSQFSSTSFFASLNTSLTQDRITTSRYVDDQFREVSTPVNIDQEERISLNLSFGRPIKLIRSRINLNTNGSYTHSYNLVNNELFDVNRWSRTAGISFTNMNSKVLEYQIGARWTFTDNYYPANSALNQSTLFHNYSASVTLTFLKKWRFNAGYNFNLYTSDRFAEDQSFPLMSLGLSRTLLPGDRGELKLSVFDLLDKNRGLSRSANINYLEELRSNSVGRYGMLSFIYNIQGMGTGRGANEIRVMEIR